MARDFCCRPQLVVPNSYSYNGVDVSFSPYDGCSRSAMQGEEDICQSPVNLSQAILSPGLQGEADHAQHRIMEEVYALSGSFLVAD
ncbi:hypothetical protein BHM03_00049211 [Ensete ventricosum]|nr:hypothetical protein BHM03_00049211 [Ensete ventricosum]